MDLRLYDFEGNLLGYSDRIISAYRELKFNGIGSGEFHIDTDDPLAHILAQNKYVLLEQDGVFQDIVIGIRLSEDFAIYTRSLSWLLSKMIIPPFSKTGTVADIAQELLASSYGCDIHFGNAEEFSSSVTFETDRAELLAVAMENCLNMDNAGLRVRFSHDDGRFYLDILKGEDLEFYVSENDCTLDNLTFEEDLLDTANSACYLQRMSVIDRWDPTDNLPTLTNKSPENFGKCYYIPSSADFFFRFNIDWRGGDYIYCDTVDGIWKRGKVPPEDFYFYIEDADVNSKFKWFSLASGTSLAEVQSEISALPTTRRFDAVAKNLKFMQDYNLGDFVKVQFNMGGIVKTVPCRFSQVIINCDSSGCSENPTLEEVN